MGERNLWHSEFDLHTLGSRSTSLIPSGADVLPVCMSKFHMLEINRYNVLRHIGNTELICNRAKSIWAGLRNKNLNTLTCSLSGIITPCKLKAKFNLNAGWTRKPYRFHTILPVGTPSKASTKSVLCLNSLHPGGHNIAQLIEHWKH